MTRTTPHKLAFLAAAVALATAGGASAQIVSSPKLPAVGAGVSAQTPAGSAAVQGQTTPGIGLGGTLQTPPVKTPPLQTPPLQTPPIETPPGQAAIGAETAGTPSSATVAGAISAGSEIKDPSGVAIGVIAGDGTAADGSATVMVTQGEKKFALPRNSLSVGADGAVSTTATKAQIDATLAGAVKPK